MHFTGLSPSRYGFGALLIAALVIGCRSGVVSISPHPAATDASDTPRAKIVFLAGRDSHGPGEHEHRAGSELLDRELRARYPGLETVVVSGGWPADETIFDGSDAVVIYCDGGKGHLINSHLDSFNRLLDQGIGVSMLHYAVEVPKDSAAATTLLRAVGGYFETDWSVNPHWKAEYTSLPPHAITRHVKPFAMQDEWYFNMRFQPDMAGVTPLLSAVAPAHTMDRRNGPHSGNDAVRKMVAQSIPQVTAWAYQRPGGGRGFGFTGGHFHANWQHDDMRKLVLNAIAWTAQLDES